MLYTVALIYIISFLLFWLWYDYIYWSLHRIQTKNRVLNITHFATEYCVNLKSHCCKGLPLLAILLNCPNELQNCLRFECSCNMPLLMMSRQHIQLNFFFNHYYFILYRNKCNWAWSFLFFELSDSLTTALSVITDTYCEPNESALIAMP